MAEAHMKIDALIAQAKVWIAEHRMAGREIEEAAGYVRLKALQDAKAALP